MAEKVYLAENQLHTLIVNKLISASLDKETAMEVANHLVYADLHGIYSHGSIRVKHYCERLKHNGYTLNPNQSFEQTGPCSGIYEGDNGMGFVSVKKGMDKAIELAKENGIGVVGVRNISHCGTMSYYLRQATSEGLIAISMCQSDPAVVPHGGLEPYFGTNPFGFGAPQRNGEPVIFDMATTVQAWGKIQNAMLENKEIPSDWALDIEGKPTTDPNKAALLMPMSNAKGYGLMMMIDILAGSMLGLNFGKHVSTMSADLSQKRGLGQFNIVINPKFFNNDNFLDNITQMINELHEIKPSSGFEQVKVPGENAQDRAKANKKNGIPVHVKVYEYLLNDEI